MLGNEMSEPILRLEAVSKTYYKGGEPIRALDQVQLEVEAGEFVMINGPSGSGKTTLLTVASGIDEPDSGTVYFDGKPVHGFSRSERRDFLQQHLGFCLQSPNLWGDVSALHNVSIPLRFAGYRPGEADRMARETLVALGMEDRLGHMDTELSGGQQQRVALARALAKNPALLLADEPTGNLDSETGRHILGLLARVAAERRTAVVLVTHDPDAREFVDRSVTIRDGRLLQSVSP